MKKLSTIIMALALVLGMSQCKKQETPTNGNGGEKVHITLNVSNGESLDVNVNDNGGRHAVAPNLGVIQFRNGDVLYVGHNGKYIGQLTYQNGAFAGDLETPTNTADFLHFYFVGNAALSEALPETIEEGTVITSRTISIDNQTSNLPVLCYGHSTKTYGSATNYSAVLEYKCALVRFNLQNQVYMNVNLSNVLTEATIDFANNAITPTATTGTMTLYGEEGVITHRWGILLPGTTLTGHSDLEWKGTGSMPTIVANGYVDAGVGEGILIKNPSIPAPTTNAVVNSAGDLSVFSVSPTQKVYFSKANLKYNTSNGTWGFHDSQVDECYGSLYQKLSITERRPYQSKYGQAWVAGSSTSSMDRFCWGYNDYDNTLSETDFITGRKDLSRTLGTDWGCAFPTNTTYWRTPTASEWDYLLNNTARGNKRFMMVKFLYHIRYPNSPKDYNSYCSGLMLFPDNFDESGLQLSSRFNTSWYNQTDAYHLIDAAYYDDPESNMYKLLNAGVVFLPAVGMRAGGTDYNTNIYGSSYYYIYDYYESDAEGIVPQGYYWTASCDGYETWSKYLWIGVNGGTYYALSNNTTTATETFGVHNTMANVPNMREIGMCVRLVWDAN